MAAPSNVPARKELFPGQLSVQYTRAKNDTYGITPDVFERFFRRHAAGNFIGLAGTYDLQGKLKRLALSTDEHVLELQLDAQDLKTVVNGKRIDPKATNTSMANIMSTFFTDGKYRFLAFDADRLAAALYLDYKIRISGLVYLQSLKQSAHISPSSFEALFSMFRRGGYSSSDEDHRNEIEDAFDESSEAEKYYKRLKFRATSTYFMSTLWSGEIEDAIEIDAMVNTTVAADGTHSDPLPDSALEILARASRVHGLMELRKSDYQTHEFQSATISNDLMSVIITLERFSTRLRKQPGGGSQTVIVEIRDARNKKKEIETVLDRVDGKKATLKIVDPEGFRRLLAKNASPAQLAAVKPPTVINVSTIGKDEPSANEEQLRSMIIRRLLRQSGLDTTPVERMPIVKIIWRDAFPSLNIPSLSSPRHPSSGPSFANASMPATVTVRLNESQRRAVVAFCSPFADGAEPSSGRPKLCIVQGPPGSGKTTMISAMVQWLGTTGDPSDTDRLSMGTEAIWLVAQSNVAVKNIAEKLDQIGFQNYKLIVSSEFKTDWHDHLYTNLRPKLIDSRDLPKTASRTKILLGPSRVILCTLSMLSSKTLVKCGLIETVAPPVALIVDEASQVDISSILVPLQMFSYLKRVCFVGDDKQLGPHGVEDVSELKSVFEVEHLRAGAAFLDVQYRMPVPIGDFISESIYDGKLRSHHRIQDNGCIKFVDVPLGIEEFDNNSWVNRKEIEAVIQCARLLLDAECTFRIITGYDAQRNEIEKALKLEYLPWEQTVFNVDSFQGNECDFIILSIVRTNLAGFLHNRRRTNVMLSRAKMGMVVVAKRTFLETAGKDTLIAQMAASFAPNWLTMYDIPLGTKLFDPVVLKGVDIEDDTPRPLPTRVRWGGGGPVRRPSPPRGRGRGFAAFSRSRTNDIPPVANDGWGSTIRIQNGVAEVLEDNDDADSWGEDAAPWESSTAGGLSPSRSEPDEVDHHLLTNDASSPVDESHPSSPQLRSGQPAPIPMTSEPFDWSEEPENEDPYGNSSSYAASTVSKSDLNGAPQSSSAWAKPAKSTWPDQQQQDFVSQLSTRTERYGRYSASRTSGVGRGSRATGETWRGGSNRARPSQADMFAGGARDNGYATRVDEWDSPENPS